MKAICCAQRVSVHKVTVSAAGSVSEWGLRLRLFGWGASDSKLCRTATVFFLVNLHKL